ITTDVENRCLLLKLCISAREILESERAYIKYLEYMIRVYYKGLQQHSTAAHPLITAQEVNIIFSNCEAILQVNKTLLAELETKMAAWSSVQTLGDAFLSLVKNRLVF